MKVIIGGLSRRYYCCIANPPYMGKSSMNAWLNRWVEREYRDEKEDLCTCFIQRSFSMTRLGGYSGLVTMHSWMSLKRYERMRRKLFAGRSITTMAHLGARAFDAISGEVVQTTATVFFNGKSNINGRYIRLVDFRSPDEKRIGLQEAIAGRDDISFASPVKRFIEMPECILAYQASPAIEEAFRKGSRLDSVCDPRQGAATGDNARFVRLWWEVCYSAFERNAGSVEEALACGSKWFPFNKGGSFRKWYGNNDCVISFDNASFQALAAMGNHLPSRQLYFRPSITWSKIASGDLSMRYKPKGHIFSDAGMCIFANEVVLKDLQAFLNSSVVNPIARIISPTLHFEKGQVAIYPYLGNGGEGSLIQELVDSNRGISKYDWDSFETSWDYSSHPLLPRVLDVDEEELIVTSIEANFSHWARECESRFTQLKANEEELNHIFARIYNMEDEVPIEVSDDKVSVRRADIVRDVKSLVSYGVGCMLGRYSAEKPGLILADAGQTVDDFRAFVPNACFLPDEDNILPILPTEDVGFGDDIVAFFKQWLVSVYGRDKLDENVAFIEHVLGKDLRTYFVKDFYKDHCNTYQVTGSGKRPIYWLFSSPKGSFNALIYMHRYDRNTVSRVLTDYVRPYRQKLSAQAGVLEASGNARDASKANKYRAMVSELEAWERDILYPLSQQHVEIDLDDGVKVNYKKFPGALAKVQGLS